VTNGDCPRCPELIVRLAGVTGGLHALAAFVDDQLAEPTMPWRDLLPLVVARAENLAAQAQGRF
jgi:hypothetical protein